MGRPLILTLQIEEAAQVFYEDLRLRYFPPERNLVPAHLTLFHHLPDEDQTRRVLLEAAQGTRAFRLTDPHLLLIGRGVAVFFLSPDVKRLHAALASSFRADLIPQDRQRFQPHIVVQNKVDSSTAKDTLAELQACPLVEPYAIGLIIWRYLGGHWERLADLPFSDAELRNLM